MSKSRITVGIIYSLLATLVLLMIYRVRIDYNWGMLGDLYRVRTKYPFELPVVVPLLWPFAPVAWWSWISPVAFGTFVAARLRRPIAVSTMIASLVGTAFLITAVLEVFWTYTRRVCAMGDPPDAPIEPKCLLGNLGLVALTLSLVIWAIYKNREAGYHTAESGPRD